MSRKRRRFIENNVNDCHKDECCEERLDECCEPKDPCDDLCDKRPIRPSSLVFHTIEDHLPSRDRCPWFNPCGDDDDDDDPCCCHGFDEPDGAIESDGIGESNDNNEDGYMESRKNGWKKKCPSKKQYCGYVELRPYHGNSYDEEEDGYNKSRGSDKLYGKFKMILCEEGNRGDDVAPMGGQKKHKQCKEFYGCIKLYREEKRRYGNDYEDEEEYAMGHKKPECEKFYGRFKLYPCDRYTDQRPE